MKRGDKVRLIPKSRNGKASVIKHGNHAVIILINEDSVCTKTPDGNFRLISKENDKDFSVRPARANFKGNKWNYESRKPDLDNPFDEEDPLNGT